jgi:hypothetical protein
LKVEAAIEEASGLFTRQLVESTSAQPALSLSLFLSFSLSLCEESAAAEPAHLLYLAVEADLLYSTVDLLSSWEAQLQHNQLTCFFALLGS